jgi:hypothetical protein
MHRNDFENRHNTFRRGQSRHEPRMCGSLSTGSGEFLPHLRRLWRQKPAKSCSIMPVDHVMARTAYRIDRASKNAAETSRRF